jgi:hypothetical protein
MAATNSFLDTVDQLSDQYNAGNAPREAKAFYGKVAIEIGFKIYASGVSQVESWFPFNSADADKDKRKTLESTAMEKAVKFAENHNIALPRGPQLAIQITLFKAHVLNGAADRWGGDQYKVVPVWKSSPPNDKGEIERKTDYSQIIKPAFDKLGINHWGEYYAKIILVPNVQGRMEDWTHDVEEDDPENPGQKKKVSRTDKVPTKVWVPDVVYPTEALLITAAKEAAAQAQAGANGNGASAPVQEEERPEGYTKELWAEYRGPIVADLGTMTVQAVASKYGIPVPFIMAFKLKNGIQGPA